MLPSKTARAIRVKESRISVDGDPASRSRNVTGNIGKKPRGKTRRANAPVSSVESRLIEVGRIAFRFGGED
jgi:hypothetical protein